MSEILLLQTFSLSLTSYSCPTNFFILVEMPVLIQYEVVDVEAEIKLLNKGAAYKTLERYWPLINLVQSCRE